MNMRRTTSLPTTAALLLFALVAASPVHAAENDLSNWLQNLFGISVSADEKLGMVSNKSFAPEDTDNPVYVPLGPGLGGGDPGVDPD